MDFSSAPPPPPPPPPEANGSEGSFPVPPPLPSRHTSHVSSPGLPQVRKHVSEIRSSSKKFEPKLSSSIEPSEGEDAKKDAPVDSPVVEPNRGAIRTGGIDDNPGMEELLTPPTKSDIGKTIEKGASSATLGLQTAIAVDEEAEEVAKNEIDDDEKKKIEQRAADDVEARFVANAVQGEEANLEEENELKKQQERKRGLAIAISLLIFEIALIATSIILYNKYRPDPTMSPTTQPTIAPTTRPPIFIPPTTSPPTDENVLPAPPGTLPGTPPVPIADNESCEKAFDVATQIGLPPFGGEILDLASVALAESCGAIDRNGIGVWYRLDGDGSRYTASTCGGNTAIDTQISIYAGVCSKLRCVSGNDQTEFCGDGDESLVAFNTEVGQSYYIYVHARRRGGFFSLAVAPLDTNDICDDAVPISIGEAVFGSTIGATLDSDVTCNGDPLTPGVWFSHTAEAGGYFRVTVASSTGQFVAQVTLMTGTSCDDITCATVFSQSLGAFVATGDTLYVLVYGVDFTGVGDFQAELRYIPPAPPTPSPPGQPGGPPPPPPPPNYCFVPELIMADTVVNRTQFYSQDIVSCGDMVFPTSRTYWFVTIGSGTPLTASTCGLDEFDTQISIYTGSCDSLECVDGNDQACGDQSSVTWFAELSTEYFIVVHGFGDEHGTFQLSLDETSIVASPVCSAPILAPSDGVSILGTTTDGTFDPIQSNCTDASLLDTPGAWYLVEGAGRTLTAGTCGSITNSNTTISIFSGDCESLECTSATKVKCGSHESIIWDSELGVSYLLFVQAHDDDGIDDGTRFVLAVDETALNDHCSQSLGPISPNNSPNYGSTRSASIDEQVGSSSRGVWFSIIGTGTDLTASTCSETLTNFETMVRVFTGECGDLTGVETSTTLEDCAVGTSVMWTSVVDELYYVLVSGTDSTAFGNFALSIYSPDVCIGASGPVPTDSSPIFGSTADATPDAGAASVPGIWYTVVGKGVPVIVDTCNNVGVDISVTIYTDCDQLDPVYARSEDDWDCPVDSYFLNEDQVYFILVSSFEQGEFSFSLVLTAQDCSTAQDRYPNGPSPVRRIQLSTVGFPPPTEEVIGDCTFDPAYPAVWYRFPYGVDRNITVTASGGECSVPDGCCDTRITILEKGRGPGSGCGRPLQCLVSNFYDAANTTGTEGGCATTNEVSFASREFDFYYIVIQNVSSIIGGDVETRASVADHDTCQDAVQPIVDLNFDVVDISDFLRGIIPPPPPLPPGTVTASPSSAPSAPTDSPSDMLANPNRSCGDASEGIGGSFWYTVIGTGNLLSASTQGYFSPTDTNIAVFSGTDCTELDCVVGDGSVPADSGSGSVVFWISEVGVQYYVRVSDSTGEGGGFQLLIRDHPCPVSITLPMENIQHFGEIAFEDVKDPLFCPIPPPTAPGQQRAVLTPGMWFEVAGNGTDILLDTCWVHTEFDTIITVYSGGTLSRCDEGAIGPPGIGGPLTCVGVNDNFGTDGPCGSSGSFLRVSTQPFTQYFILVRGISKTSYGEFALNLRWDY